MDSVSSIGAGWHIYGTLLNLPHSTATLLQMTINEDGVAVHTEVVQNSSFLILDQYASSSSGS